MLRKVYIVLGIALILVGLAGTFAATEAHASDRTPCVKIINGVEIRTCAVTVAPAVTEAKPWWVNRFRHPREHTCHLVRCAIWR